MSQSFNILVTGAAGALGRSVVDTLLLGESRLALLDRDQALLEQAFPTLAGDPRHLLAAADVTDRDAMEAVAGRAIERFGRLHALVHVAGGFAMGEGAHALSRAQWDAMMNLNAWSFVAASGAVVPHMLQHGGGKIVAISARSAKGGLAKMGAYIASKSALQRLVEALSAETRERRINVNSVAPSVIDTPANRHDMPDADPTRWVPPQRLAATIAFLVSSAADQIHGQHIEVSGLS